MLRIAEFDWPVANKEEVIAESQKILKKYPNLSEDGFSVSKSSDKYSPINPTTDDHLNNLAYAFSWFGVLESTKSINTRRAVGSSYGLKHHIERLVGHYMGNGNFICAALVVGLKLGYSRDSYLDYLERMRV